MADISRYIEKINKAKYGEEVRGSISDALTAMNEEAENAKEWATGEGTDVPGGGSVPGTENNAEYFAQQAAAQAEAAAGSAASGIAALANEAPTFSATTAYTVGDYVLYNSVLYRFAADHAAGAWTETDATAVTLGQEFDDLKSALVEVSNQPNISWIIGSSISSNGTIGEASSYAYSSAIAVDAGGMIRRSTPYRDANSRILLIHVCQYDNTGTFISRTTLGDGGEVVFENNTASIRFNFGRSASLGVQMTAEDVTTYFHEKVYRKAVLAVDVNDIIEAKIAESVQTNDLINIPMSQSIATNSYNNELKQVPTNTYFFTSFSWFNDYPHGIGATYFWIITLSSERNDRSAVVSAGSQICINPTNGNYAVRRVLSGVWTEWSVINVSQYVSLPKYAAFGDSLTFGAVWDSEQETQWYQADFKDQIPTRIANAIGSNEFTNYGVSGARFVKQSPSDTSTIIGDKVKSVDLTNINLVTIGGGRNDSATSLGDGTTATANDGTICGAVVDILTYLTTTYPKLQIVMYGVTPQLTSTSHDPEHIFTRVFSGGWSLATYYTEMAKVCARFGVPFIDWYDCPLILRWGVLSGGYSSGVQNWSHPLESSIYKQMGNYLGGRVSGYYRG